MLQRAQNIVREAEVGRLSTLIYYPQHGQHSAQLTELIKEVHDIKRRARKDVIASITGYVPKD